MRRIALALLLTWPSAATAADPTGPAEDADCAAAIATAERSIDIPAGLLMAIGQVESGRPDPTGGAVQPWPWTIDVRGEGRFFAKKAEAIAATEALKARGVSSIDIGCLQVNLLHHPAAFLTLDEAFDPLANALYAARFLRLLYGQTGDWLAAVAAYHSQTQGIGAPYREKVLAVWTPPGSPTRPPADSRAPGFNPFVWLGAGSRDRDRWSAAALDGRSAAWRPVTPSVSSLLVDRVIAAVAACTTPTEAQSPPRAASAEVAPPWKGPGGTCSASPFAKPAALHQILAQP